MNNKSQEKHTPGPWQHDVLDIYADNDARTNIGSLSVRQVDFRTAIANARFTVKAVNCHDDLLEACNRALDAMKAEQMSQAKRGESVLVQIGIAIQECRKAIEKASAQ